MADGNDLTIDSLQIEIASSSQNAEQSIDKLATSLNGLLNATKNGNKSLKAVASSLSKIASIKGLDNVSIGINTLSNTLQGLNRVDVKSNGVSSFVNALARLNKTNIQGLSSNMNGIANSLITIGDASTKTNGINSFVNSLVRLGKNKTTIDTSLFSSLAASFGQLDGVSENASNSLKALSSFIRSADKISDTANAFPALAIEMQEFFDHLSNATISDNVARTAEGLGEIAKACGKASVSTGELYQNFVSNHSALRILAELLKTAGESFKTFWQLVKKVASGLKLLAVEVGKLGKNLGKFLGAEVNLAITGLKKLGKEVSGLKEKVPSVETLHLSLKNLLATVIGFRGITGIFNWAKEALTLGGDITEIDHIIESVFGENMTGYIEEWSRNAINNFGIAQGAAKQYAGTLNAMFKASNITADKSSVMAVKMVELAGDLSAFYNIDTADAYQKIQAGLAGMVRPLRSLGLDLSVASLKEYALAQGITKSYTEMTQAEKVMLRYQYLLDATKTQSGDFARTSGKLTAA